MMPGGLLEDESNDDGQVQQMLHPLSRPPGPYGGRRQEEFMDSPPRWRDIHYTRTSHGAGSQDGGNYNPLKITRVVTTLELKSQQAYLADNFFLDFLNYSEAIKRYLPVFRRSNIEITSYHEIFCFIGALIHPKLPHDIFQYPRRIIVMSTILFLPKYPKRGGTRYGVIKNHREHFKIIAEAV